MKKIKVLMVAVLACCAISVSAQDAYEQAVKKYMATAGNSSMGKEELIKTIKAVAAQSGKSESDAEKYVNDDLYPKMIQCITDAFKKGGCTAEDLNVVSAAFETAEGKKALADFNTGLSEDNMQKSMSVIQQPMMAIMQGQPADPIQAPEVSNAYKQKFHTCYTICNLGSTLLQAIDAMKASAGNDPQVLKIFDNLGMYLALNGENIMLTTCKDVMTEGDLDFYNSTYSTPSGKKIMAAYQDAVKNVISISMQGMKEFSNKK